MPTMVYGNELPFGGSYSQLSRSLGLSTGGRGTFSGANDDSGGRVFGGLNPSARQWMDRPENARANLSLFSEGFARSNPLVARALPNQFSALNDRYGIWAAQQGGVIRGQDGSTRPATFVDFLEQLDAPRFVHSLAPAQRGDLNQRAFTGRVRYTGG